MTRIDTWHTAASNDRNFTSILRMFIVALLFGCTSAQVQAQLLTQDFNFSGALTANGFTAHSGGGTNALSTTTGLSYNGHAGSGIGNAVLVNNLGGEDANVTFTSSTGPVVYYSFLVNVTDAAAAKTGDYFFHVGSPGGASWAAFSGRVFARIVSGNVNFGISNTSTVTYGTTNFSKNTTYLIVVKHSIVTGTGFDPLSMWVIPSGMPADETAAGTAELTNAATNGTDAINAVGLRQGSTTNSPQVVVDAIRVGTTWTSVVPASASAPSVQVSNISFSNTGTNSTDLSWTNGNGNGRIVKINTSNSFTAPVSGNNPSAVSYTGTGEAVVYNGTGSSTTTTGLLPGNTYHFRAYEYDNAGYLYNTATATGNPNSITINYPAPVATSLSPSSASAGASTFTLTVSGSDFYPASVINWNGSPRTTSYVNSTTLTASIPATDIATAGTATVTVTNPVPGGGTSTGLSFAINASSSPLIAVNASLTTFTTEAGTPSASQSYTISGSNLTDDITVTPPAGFEIRTGSNAFSTSPLVLSAGAGSSSSTEFTVTVDSKDASHPNFGTGYPSGYLLNGAQGPALTLVRGTTYKFYFDGQGTCCSSTLGHPFIFTSSAVGGGANSGDVISTGVTQYGDSTFFTPDATTPSSLYYMCDVHQSMGSSITVIDPVIGSVASTTIDIRFNPASSGAVVDSVQHSSTGATTEWLSVTGFALESEPSLASTIAFGTINGNSIEVNTSGGNGASRIIIIRQGSAVNFTPTDAVAVSGVNSSFTTALDQGSGNKVVYDGTGNTVTVTGLNALTTYHFAVFEYNGSGNTSNYNTTAGTADATTLAAEPGTAATITLTRLKTDTAVTALSSGTGASRLIVLSTSAVSFVPVDGTTYSGASAAIGTATDLGSGNLLVFNTAIATPLTLTGLSAGTTYYLRSFEYNGSGSSTNYHTSTTGNLSFTTPSNLGYNGGLYTQDFNGLPSTTGSYGMTGFKWGPYYLSTPTVNGTNLTGWQHANLGGTSADLVFAVDNGGSSSGGSKSYGVTGSSNRALGSLSTGSAIPAFGLVLVNNTAGPLTTVSLNYTGQQWRNGGSGTPNQLLFSYQVGGADITAGTFTTESSLNFNNPISGGLAAALDGTLPANQLAVTSTFQLNSNWLPGQTLVIRWNDVNDSGNDEGMAIDDLSFSATGPVAPTQQDSAISFINVTTTGLDVNWLSGDGSNRIVKMNTSNSFTNPVDGQDYTANAVYSGSGEQVVYNGNGNVVHVDGLSAGTTYSFRVFAYNGSGASAVYNTATATDNPASQATVAASSATQLAIISINGGADPSDGVPFSVVIQSQDALGNPQTVSTSTTVTLSVASGVGTLGGTVSGIIPIGASSVTITGVTYSPEDFFVELTATASAGQTLSPGTSAQFNVLGVATQLAFVSLPASGIVNQTIPNFQVQAYRGDFTLDPLYTGAITVSKLSGPGTLSGTLTVNAVAGTATFSGISFSQPGTYELEASAAGLTSAFSTTITITLVPSLTELVVPKYISGKTSASAHNARMPFAVCLQLDNLVPNTAYDIRAGVGTDTTANTTYGSGNVWLGTFFGSGTIANAFTSDANGSSGPFWIYIQPTASSTNSRFAAGFNHNLRIGFAPTGGLMPLEPSFVGSKLMKALDIGSNSQSASTSDDGAFLRGSSGICLGGKYILVYDNETGSGDPMFSYQARQMVATNSSQSDLPASINDVLSQGGTSAIGDYVALVPTGANNSNGVRRIEARNADNTLFNAATDADGVWSGGANTTTLGYRGIANVTNADATLTTLSITASATAESCTGALDGTATATVVTGTAPVTYSWNTNPVQTTATAVGLAAGVYTVTATDASGCSQSATVTVAAPSSATITPSGPTTFCTGGSVSLSAGAANSYLWSTGETTQAITVSTSGSYVVTVTDGSCTATALPVVVTVSTYAFNGTLFSENIGVPTGTTSVNTYTGWQNAGVASFSNNATGTDVRTTTASTAYTGSSGGGNVFFGTTGGNSKQLIISGINTTGYSNLVMTYGLLRSDLTNGMTVEVSDDGVNYSPLTVSQPTVSNTWQLITASGSIPSTSNLRLRFSKNATTSFRLDDVKITGSTNTVGVVTPGPTTVCGSGTVTLSASVPSGILWSTGASTRTIQTSTSGSYSFTATDANGCTATSNTVSVLFTAPPVWYRDLDGDTFGNNNDTLSACTQPAGYVFDNSDCNDNIATVNPNGTEVCNGIDDDCDGDIDSDDSVVNGEPLWYADVDADGFGDANDTIRTCNQPVGYVNNNTDCNDANGAINPNAQEICDGGIDNDCDGLIDSNDANYIPSDTTTTTASACDSYTWSLNGQTYTASGTYAALSACTLNILQLTITASSSNTTTASACDSYTWSVNATTYTQSGTYSVVTGCQTELLQLTITPCASDDTLTVKFILEGFYDGVAGMVPSLLNAGVGTSLTETDTVLIELRDGLNTFTSVASGIVVAQTDGTAQLVIPAGTLAAGSSQYIVVTHRNAIQTWSALPVSINGNTTYDFTTSSSQAYGDNMFEISTGIFAFFSGDVSPQDGVVDILDQGNIDNDSFNFAGGYLPTDINGDGVVDILDQGICDNNAFNFIGSAAP